MNTTIAEIQTGEQHNCVVFIRGKEEYGGDVAPPSNTDLCLKIG
jgi:hypothetical protein